MAIQILSDLHLEAGKSYDSFWVVPTVPYLALLGDIGNIASHKDECLAFLTEQLQQFKIVFFVPGNHEAYHSSWPATLQILGGFERQVASKRGLGEFVLLERRAYKIPGTSTTILGCSLFSFVPQESAKVVEMQLNDFRHTTDWGVAQHNAAHQRDLTWLNDQVERLSSEDRIIIMTHWSPSTDLLALDSKHVGSPITCAFSTNLSGQACFEDPKVRSWVFGHTHYNCDFRVKRGSDAVGRLRLVTNQRGYYFQQAAGFDPGKTIALS